MGELDIADRRNAQDGRVSIRYDGHPVDLRIAVLPTTFGEKVVLRILHRASGRLGISDLGMNPEAEAVLTRALKQPYGAVLTVGPTGSGKTTTLYAALEFLNDDERSLATIEDPVENQIPGITQVEVNVRAGLTFASGLRTMLRSDPDVVLIGEVRDEETARIAIQAAMTGHLVLTTLHTHNAASSIARLRDMGVDQSLIATSINCIVAQRLARELCVHCREPYVPTQAEQIADGLNGVLEEGEMLYRAEGLRRVRRHGLQRARRDLRGDADQRQDPPSDRGLDGGDLRRRRRRRDDHPARGRDPPRPRRHLLARGDPPRHRRPLDVTTPRLAGRPVA